jgi:hypothetical protein
MMTPKVKDAIELMGAMQYTTPSSVLSRAGEILAAEVVRLSGAIDRAGWDISPCRGCGELIVCLPDGLPMCTECATKEDPGDEHRSQPIRPKSGPPGL